MSNEVPNQEQAQDAQRPSVSGVKRLVMHLWWYRPWNIVKWVYTESDDIGLRVLKAEKTTYLFNALLLAAFLWFINLLITLTGIPQNKSDFFIFDA